MNIKLKFPERVKLTDLLNEFKGNISGLSKIIKIVNQLEVNEKDMKEIGLVAIPNLNGGTSFKWDVKKDKGKSIEFDDIQIGFIKQIVSAKNSRNEFTLDDTMLLELFNKLGINEPDIQEQKSGEKSA